MRAFPRRVAAFAAILAATLSAPAAKYSIATFTADVTAPKGRCLNHE